MHRANQGGWDGLVTQHVSERREIREVFWWDTLRKEIAWMI